MTRANNAPWFTKTGAANSIVPISHFVGPTIFALKAGGYGCLFSVAGIDPESRTDEDLDVRVRGVEVAMHGLPQDACLYQYTRVLAGFDIPRQDMESGCAGPEVTAQHFCERNDLSELPS